MENLIKQLFETTQTLKEEYIQKTKVWANANFELAVKRNSYKSEDWCNLLGVTPEVKNAGRPNEFIGFPNGFYNTKDARVLDRMQNEARRIAQMGLEEYTAKEIKSAELHYIDSIQKLAFRIEKKGLNEASLKMKTGRVGVNIETVISDGIKTVKAFTVVASGPIQKPHYRYLIK